MGLGRVLHWGPLVAIGDAFAHQWLDEIDHQILTWTVFEGIIKWVSLATVYCSTMWWPPAGSLGGLAFLSSFLFFAGSDWFLWKQYFFGDVWLESFTLPGMTMYHFLSAMVDGPGYLPLGWKPKEVFNFTYFIFPSFSLKMLLLKYLHLQGTPEELVNLLQWCSECAGYKAPRAHHCRKCGRYKIEFVCNQIQMSTFS